MDSGPINTGPETADAKALEARTAASQGASGRSTPELDLDRLVWDPEYRRAMRHLIKRGD